jgi:ribosomal protein S18 acetylase RimI-like enzyme
MKSGKSGPGGLPLRVRRGSRSDLSFIANLSGDVFGVYGPYGEWVGRWFESDSAITVVATLSEKPTGFAMLGRFADSSQNLFSAELLAIAVEPGSRRRGVGRMLLTEIEEIATSMGVCRLFLHTAKENYPAQKLFENCDFTPAGVIGQFYPEGQDGLLMVKDLL